MIITLATTITQVNFAVRPCAAQIATGFCEPVGKVFEDMSHFQPSTVLNLIFFTKIYLRMTEI